MKIVFFLLGLVAAIFTVEGQEIKGFVFSETDNKPVEFASVVLLQLPDSALVTGGITYTMGEYSFTNVKPGKYTVKSTFVGFENGFVDVKVTGDKNTFIADTLFLKSKSTNIDEVVVKGDMVRGEELVDRTVYSIPPEISKSSTDGYDLLRKIPSVQVDFNNNITLNGTSNFIITVDGKQRDKEFLARLLPEDIKSIEIIHNPSGKYDASIDGVINIKLTDEARIGVSGNFVLAVKPGKTNMVFGNAGIDYGRKKITYYVSGYGFVQNLQNTLKSDYRYKLIDSITDITGEGDFSISSGAINSGFDYYINNKNTLSFNYSFKPNTYSSDMDNNGLIYNGTVNHYGLENTSNTSTSSNESNYSLFYKKEFEKPIQELTIESTVYDFQSGEDNGYTSQVNTLLNSEILSSSSRDEDIKNYRNYYSTKVDYVHPLGINMRLEAGYQFYYQTMEYDYKSTEDNDNNIFEYSELRNAAYAGLTYNYKKWGLKATLRTEYSDISINDSASNEYPVFLPSTNIQYKINGSQNIKFTYNRRINRPGIYQLNPYEKVDNYYNISTGNPDLEPVLRDKLELKYTLNFKKNFISPYVYYTHISDKIGTLYDVTTSPLSGSTVTYSRPDNVLTGHETGFGLNAMLWNFNIDGRIYNGKYDAYSNGRYSIDESDYFSYYVRSYIFYQLMEQKLSVFGFVGYQGVQVDAQTKTYSTPFYGFGGQFNHKNHTFGAFYFLPFNNELTISRAVTDTDFIRSEIKNSFDVKAFIQITYSYKFNKGKSVKKVSRDTKVESDTKQQGIGR